MSKKESMRAPDNKIAYCCEKHQFNLEKIATNYGKMTEREQDNEKNTNEHLNKNMKSRVICSIFYENLNLKYRTLLI